MYELEALRGSPASRRAFLTRMSAAGIGSAAVLFLAGTASARNPKSRKRRPRGTGTGDPAFPGIPGDDINEIVLNFALTLEILEADLYRQALNKATGRPIDAPLEAKASTYRLSIPEGNFCSRETASASFTYLKQFAFAEAAHRDFLRSAINASAGDPVEPNPGGYRFPGGPGANLAAIMTQILPLEETGVRAYLGAAPFLTDLKLTQTAGTIFTVEARHSDAIRVALNLPPGPERMPGDKQVIPNQPSENTLEYFLDPATVIQRVQAYFV